MTTYNLTSSIPAASALSAGDILNCPYSGTYKTVTLPPGKYKLECWGAEGGSGASSGGYIGGKGGMSYGTIILEKKSDIYIFAGGGGAGGRAYAGSGTSFNGGGVCSHTDSYWSCGGGASDIRIGNSLYSRVIVAGGGGGDGVGGPSGNGGAGGGTSGILGTNGSTFEQGTAGTQTSGGTTRSGYNTISAHGSFGSGGYTSGSHANGGGGGWYGGGASGPHCGGAGGSGYVYTASTASNYPSGCLLDSSYYLTNAATVAGNKSFTDYSGSTVTGHSGDGACRISVLEFPKTITISASSGGTCTANKSMAYPGESVSFTFTPNSDYYLYEATLNGSSIMSSLSKSGGIYTATISGNTSVVATYKKNPSVTTSASSGGVCTANKSNARPGDSVELIFTPDSGYYLANATINGTSIIGDIATTGGTYTVTISTDTTVVATYAKVFDIAFGITGSGTIRPSDSKVYCAIGSDFASIEYTFTPAAKFDLTYAAVGSTDITSSLHTYGGTYTANIAENTDITAVFKEYVVNTATSSGGGVVNVSEKTYIGDEATAHFVPYDGFLVSSVTVNGEDVTSSLQFIGTSATYTFSPTSDTEIVAAFLKACRISINSTEGGTLTTSAETVTENSDVTLTFTADSGYGLYLAHVGDEDITSQLTRSGGTYTMTVADDVSAFAEWRKVIKVNVEDYAGGLVEVLENGDVFTDHQTDIFIGDDVTFAFVPDSTHVLTKVTVFNGPTEHVLTKADMVDLYERVWYHSELTVTEDIDVIAEFTKLLKVDARCTSGGRVSWAKSGNTEYDTDEGYESGMARPTGIIVKNAAEKVSITVEPDAGHIVNSIVLEYIGTDGSASKVETIAASKEGGVTEVVNLGESAQTAERLHITAGFAYVPLKVKVDGEWKNAKLYD